MFPIQTSRCWGAFPATFDQSSTCGTNHFCVHKGHSLTSSSGTQGAACAIAGRWMWVVCDFLWSTIWGLPKLGVPQMDDLCWKIPSTNGWFGGTPILGNLHIMVQLKTLNKHVSTFWVVSCLFNKQRQAKWHDPFFTNIELSILPSMSTVKKPGQFSSSKALVHDESNLQGTGKILEHSILICDRDSISSGCTWLKYGKMISTNRNFLSAPPPRLPLGLSTSCHGLTVDWAQRLTCLVVHAIRVCLCLHF